VEIGAIEDPEPSSDSLTSLIVLPDPSTVDADKSDDFVESNSNPVESLNMYSSSNVASDAKGSSDGLNSIPLDISELSVGITVRISSSSVSSQ
jgi:hypothetical protein